MPGPLDFSTGSVTFNPSDTENKRAASPEPSCVSMKSDASMPGPLDFSTGSVTFNPSDTENKRAASPEPSYVSTKSDASMPGPLDFSTGSVTFNPRRYINHDTENKTAASPEPSCMSMKSDASMPGPLDFSTGSVTFNPSDIENKTAASPEPSCVSIKSDAPMPGPLDFSTGSVVINPSFCYVNREFWTGVKDQHKTSMKNKLSGCMVTEEGCGYVSSALSSNPSYLRELDLSYNHPGDLGVKLLHHKLQDPNYKLNKLNVDHGGESRIAAGLKKYALPGKKEAENWSLSSNVVKKQRQSCREQKREGLMDRQPPPKRLMDFQPPSKEECTLLHGKSLTKLEKVNLSLETFPEDEENILKHKTVPGSIKSRTEERQRNNENDTPQHQATTD
ncbi:hypothetical protein Q8A67_010764 [Cirrhinus molitorella]|uniref:Uncharacterized protein n=1 Tax=Cirrhinus molitorella TaxID=172907 RepID=A0AA88PM43_9TELE|nr:hypothetical protein Q8A67_010764 [Cirrhinus molitorella]